MVRALALTWAPLSEHRWTRTDRHRRPTETPGWGPAAGLGVFHRSPVEPGGKEGRGKGKVEDSILESKGARS